MKLVLILSHGQAGVERGFSMNRDVGKQNLKEETFVSLSGLRSHQGGWWSCKCQN